MDLLKNYLLTETLDREGKAVVKKYKTPRKTSTLTPMSPENFSTQMREAYERHYVENDDEEAVHIAMDGIMCNLLRMLGYGEGVDIFNNTPKWYA